VSEFSAFWSSFRPKDEASLPRIGFADSDDTRIISAVEKIKRLKLAEPVLVKGGISAQEKTRLAETLQKNSKKGPLDIETVKSKLDDPLYQGIALLLDSKIDGLIAGANRPTADVVKGALLFVGPMEGYKLIGGQFLIETRNVFSSAKTPFLFADCAVLPEPSPRALASVAVGAAKSFRFFTGHKPKVAMLSFSTRGSAQHALVDKVTEAVDIVKNLMPDFEIDGEIQVDAALDKEVASRKNVGESRVAGDANVFIFPSLEAGNIGYKLIQRFAETRVAGPILWGLKKPMSDLSRGCTVQEVVDTTLCVSMMAEKERR